VNGKREGKGNLKKPKICQTKKGGGNGDIFLKKKPFKKKRTDEEEKKEKHLAGTRGGQKTKGVLVIWKRV